jgi:hypothetical protein
LKRFAAHALISPQPDAVEKCWRVHVDCSAGRRPQVVVLLLQSACRMSPEGVQRHGDSKLPEFWREAHFEKTLLKRMSPTVLQWQNRYCIVVAVSAA